MEREAVLVGIDVGTSKVCALIGEVSRDGRLTIMGHGTVPASGLKKGVVINIDQTVRSIADAVERAERLSGWKIDQAFVGVGGQHVESLNSRGQVAVTAHHREVTREDINRAIEVARAVPIPSNREVLHVERRGFTVDGQEGVKDPLGMSALRLEVETHIVTASATAVQNLTKCVAAAGVKIDELVVDALASAEAVLSETEKELGVAVADIGAGTIDLALFQDGSPFHTRVLPVGGANVTNDVAIGLKTSIQVAEELKIMHGTCDLRSIGEDESISVSVLGEDAGRTVSRLEVSQIIEARMRETFELLEQRDPGGRRRDAAGGGHPDRRRVAAGGCRRARPRGPPDAGPGRRAVGHRRPRRHAPHARLQHRGRPAPVGRRQPRRGRPALRVGAGRRRPRPAARRHPEHLPVDTRELTVRTGAVRGLVDLTAACAGFASEAADGGDGLLSVFVPHATAGLVVVEIGAGSDDDLLAALDRLLPREERCTAIATVGRPWRRPRPAAARIAVADGAGPRRAARARDVAVDLPARPQRRQRDADRPAELPGRLRLIAGRPIPGAIGVPRGPLRAGFRRCILAPRRAVRAAGVG